MNFFQQQDRTKSRSRLLVLGFFLSILLVIGLLDLIIYANTTDYRILQNIHWFNLGIFALICFGSIVQYFKIRKGGLSVAQLVSATPIHRNMPEAKYQQLINIVDEISIAAGIAAPQLFVMDQEQGINAFVAGYNPNDTILVVTQGALNNLTRSELQGVIAHEFSHIYNSDASLNLRLLIVLGGLMFISQIGFVMIRTKNDRKGQITMLGAMLIAFGYISLLFGSIIKAAISRQRESLADASAVQFTRNPEGLVTALMKIQAQGDTALLKSKHAEQISHMCFSKAQISECFNLFATHPPLAVRIAALDPSGMLRDSYGKRRAEKPQVEANKKTKQTAQNLVNLIVPTAGILQAIGNPSADNYAHAEQMLQSVPPTVMQLLDTPMSAQSLVYALMLAHDTTARNALENIPLSIEQQINECLTNPEIKDPGIRLMLLDLAVAELKSLSKEESTKFLNNIYNLIKADNKLHVFEAMLFTILSQRLRADAYADIKIKYHSVSQLRSELTQLLAFMAKQACSSLVAQQHAFDKSLLQLKIFEHQVLSSIKINLVDIISYLKMLRYMSPRLKQQFLEACVNCINCDGKVTSNEAQVLRAVCACMDCPLPPI